MSFRDSIIKIDDHNFLVVANITHWFVKDLGGEKQTVINLAGGQQLKVDGDLTNVLFECFGDLD